MDGGYAPLGQSRLLVVSSTLGRLAIRLDDISKYPNLKSHWKIHQTSQQENVDRFASHGIKVFSTPPRFEYRRGNVIAPDWFYVILFATLAALSWIRRFSLRTLLIATTVIAAVLGLIVWLSR